jgi:hypothetical protein
VLATARLNYSLIAGQVVFFEADIDAVGPTGLSSAEIAGSLSLHKSIDEP